MLTPNNQRTTVVFVPFWAYLFLLPAMVVLSPFWAIYQLYRLYKETQQHDYYH